jgi:hypothetical protein
METAAPERPASLFRLDRPSQATGSIEHSDPNCLTLTPLHPEAADTNIGDVV